MCNYDTKPDELQPPGLFDHIRDLDGFLATLHTHSVRSIILTSDSPAARNLETICEDAGIDAKVHIGSVAGLSNAAREALLQRSEATLARVLDALLYVGFSEPFELRAALASLEQLNITISEYTLRAALRRAQGLGLPILAGGQGENYVANFHGEKETVKFCNPIRRGPKAKRYKVPTPEEICRILGIEPDRSDPLPQEAFTSNRAYRAHVHRAFVRANPGEHPLRDLAVRVGVDRRTIINYEKHVVTDVYRKPRCKRRPLRRVADLPDLFVRKGKKCGKPQARGYWLEAGGKRYAPTRGNAAMLLGEGFAVDLCRQTASFRYVDASASRTSKAVTPAEQGARAMSRAQQFLLPTMKANDPPAEPEAPADAESVPLSSLDPKTPHLREAQEPLPMSREGVTIARNERYYLHGY